MSNYIKIERADIKKNKITIPYEIGGDWERFFTKERNFQVEYNVSIENTNQSLAVLPLLCNVLPVAWICDAVIEVESLDSDFMTHIEEIKRGYQNMYPMLEFKGELQVKQNGGEVSEQSQKGVSRAGAFFSGGVDAYTTLLKHSEEEPYIFTVWGADIRLEDEKGWNRVWTHSLEVAKEYGIHPISIKTNFRYLLNERELGKAVEKSGDGWWHGFQHGIGLLGHAAPLVAVLNLSKIYIASSFPESMVGQVTCASDPTIDNQVYFCGCKVWHDGTEFDRQQKVAYIIEKSRKLQKKANLRVCWQSGGGGNCCSCEKCYRTILEIVSEGENPNEYGFEWDEKAILRCKKDYRNKIQINSFLVEQYYPVICQRMRENKSKIAHYEAYEWLFHMDWQKLNDSPIKKFRAYLSRKKFVIWLWKHFIEKRG